LGFGFLFTTKKSYSTEENTSQKLNPWYVTGLIDGDGSF